MRDMKTIFVIAFALLILFPSISLADEKKLEFSEETKLSLFFYEGEKAVFTVECNGIKVKGANVSIERNGTTYAYAFTNYEGKAEITLPDVTSSSPFTIKATKEGYGSDSFTIWILKRPKIYISAPRIVEEGREIKVKIVDNQARPVANARVTFGIEGFTEIEGFTDSNGIFSFTAPEVSVSTYFFLHATCEGYEQSDDFELWIADNRTAIIQSPLWVTEGESFNVKANASKITFAGETKSGNNVTFHAPEVNKTKAYQITAYNESSIAHSTVVVLDKVKERLLLYGSIEAMEGESIDFKLISLSDLKGKEGVCVEFNGIKKATDSSGKVIFSAPILNERYKRYIAKVCDNNYSATNWSIWIRKPEGKGLVIHGPSTVYEGENVTFNVTTLDGIPIFAMVSIENQSKYAYNGSVTFTMPEVVHPGYKTIVASAPGYLKGYKSVYVKNKEKKLFIDLESSSVNEGEGFYVQIKDSNGENVSDALVWFNFNTYHTDSNGKVYLTAPDVLLTTNYLISAEKEGYEEDSRWITVVENGLGKNFMRLIAPDAVKPWTDFSVKAIDKAGGGIRNVTISIDYGLYKKSYKTDESGEARIRSPVMGKESFFTLTAQKDGYIKDSKIVLLLEHNQLFKDLKIETSASEVVEGEGFIVKVKDQDGEEVEGASVYIDGRPLTHQTDENGIVNCKAPSVVVSRDCFIFATKPGYNFGETWIHVANTLEVMDAPVIETEDNVYEGEEFRVKVKDLYGEPLAGVKVGFNSLFKLTDEKGEVLFTAPAVSKDTFFLLSVEEEGFAPAFKIIRVMDSSSTEILKLRISSVPRVLEGSNFVVTVKDNYGYAVDNAMVVLNEQIVGYTNEYGQIKLRAPEVSRDRTFDIYATKSGYEGGEFSIEVKDKGKSFVEQYLPTLIAILIVILIAIFAYYRFR